MSTRDGTWAILGARGKIVSIGPDDEVVGIISRKEFKMLFGFMPAIDIKMTPQQEEKVRVYVKRRDGKR